MRARQAACVCAGLVAALLTGCNENTPDLRTFVANIRSQPTHQAKTIPRPRTQPFAADLVSGLRSPFLSVSSTHSARPRAAGGPHPDFDRPLEPLEKFRLGSLAMVGTMTLSRIRYALVRAPAGVVRRVGPGDHIGTNYGEITAVTASAIKVSEIVPDGIGGYRKRPARLVLNKKAIPHPAYD